MNRTLSILLIALLFSGNSLAQEKSLADFQKAMAEIQKSHVDGNVPPQSEFNAFLERDLRSYFKSSKVTYEMLRNGPTQSGVAYPKYYLWVKAKLENKVTIVGAVRVAAIEKKRFEVFDFLSKLEIQKEPEIAAHTFPGALLPRIYELAELP